jgi:hypothetical protein
LRFEIGGILAPVPIYQCLLAQRAAEHEPLDGGVEHLYSPEMWATIAEYTMRQAPMLLPISMWVIYSASEGNIGG